MAIKFTKIVEEKNETPESNLSYNVDKSGVVGDVKENSSNKQEKETTTRTRKVQGAKPLSVGIPLDNLPEPSKANPVAEKAPDKPKGKPGRPSKKERKDGEIVKVDKSILATQIFGVHQMLNVFIPGTDISEKSANDLANALGDVMEAYEIRYNKKISSLVTLVATVAVVEIPVVLRVTSNMKVKMRNAQNVQQVMQPKTVESGQPPKPQLVAVPSISVEEGEPFRG